MLLWAPGDVTPKWLSESCGGIIPNMNALTELPLFSSATGIPPITRAGLDCAGEKRQFAPGHDP